MADKNVRIDKINPNQGTYRPPVTKRYNEITPPRGSEKGVKPSAPFPPKKGK